jgi:hypothetical protein
VPQHTRRDRQRRLPGRRADRHALGPPTNPVGKPFALDAAVSTGTGPDTTLSWSVPSGNAASLDHFPPPGDSGTVTATAPRECRFRISVQTSNGVASDEATVTVEEGPQPTLAIEARTSSSAVEVDANTRDTVDVELAFEDLDESTQQQISSVPDDPSTIEASIGGQPAAVDGVHVPTQPEIMGVDCPKSLTANLGITSPPLPEASHDLSVAVPLAPAEGLGGQSGASTTLEAVQTDAVDVTPLSDDGGGGPTRYAGAHGFIERRPTATACSTPAMFCSPVTGLARSLTARAIAQERPCAARTPPARAWTAEISYLDDDGNGQFDAGEDLFLVPNARHTVTAGAIRVSEGITGAFGETITGSDDAFGLQLTQLVEDPTLCSADATEALYLSRATSARPQPRATSAGRAPTHARQ